jgi:hypothetical protein
MKLLGNLIFAQAAAGSIDLLMQALPFLFLSVGGGIVAFLLAKDKGRNVVVWTIWGFVPFLNFVALWYFIGASNLRLEKKLDALLEARRLPPWSPPRA